MVLSEVLFGSAVGYGLRAAAISILPVLRRKTRRKGENMIVTNIETEEKVYVNNESVLMVAPIPLISGRSIARIYLPDDYKIDVKESFDEVMDKMGVDRC